MNGTCSVHIYHCQSKTRCTIVKNLGSWLLRDKLSKGGENQSLLEFCVNFVVRGTFQEVLVEVARASICVWEDFALSWYKSVSLEDAFLCGFAFSAALKIKAKKKKSVGRRNAEARLNLISKLGKWFELDVAVTIWNENWKTLHFFVPGGFAEFSNCFPGLCEGKSILVPSCISQPCLPVSSTGPTRILPHLYLGCQRDVLNKVGRHRDGETSGCPRAP